VAAENEIKMLLIDITDAVTPFSITRNRSIDYQVGDIYEVKILKSKNKISKIEHTRHIKAL
jgi:hypothetical protein